MQSKTPYQSIFAATSTVTELFPRTGARFLDALVHVMLGNRLLLDAHRRKNLRQLAGTKELRRVLVIGDLNIGDAVNLQSAIAALRDFFPEAEIDYCINRYARNLVEGNHEISRLWPVFTGTYFPDRNDLSRLEEIVARNPYDLIVNFCPSFDERRLPGVRAAVGYPALAAQLIRDDSDPRAVNHIVSKSHRFVHDLLSASFAPRRVRPFTGVTVTLADSAVQRAREFLECNELPDGPLLFFNPDASSEFTRIPFAYQLSLLREMAATGVPVLVGAGHTARDIGKQLTGLLSPSLSARVVVVPSSLPLDSYAALIDFCTVFITADTGPLHIAAARKVARSSGHVFRNRTSVMSVFGATPPRIYGYDSHRPGYFPAHQDAPSFTYQAQSRCRNITCINKMAKACRRVQCFEHLDVERIAADIRQCLEKARGAASPQRHNVDSLAVNN